MFNTNFIWRAQQQKKQCNLISMSWSYFSGNMEYTKWKYTANIVWFLIVTDAIFIAASFYSLIYKLRIKGETLAFLSLDYSKCVCVQLGS